MQSPPGPRAPPSLKCSALQDRPQWDEDDRCLCPASGGNPDSPLCYSPVGGLSSLKEVAQSSKLKAVGEVSAQMRGRPREVLIKAPFPPSHLFVSCSTPLPTHARTRQIRPRQPGKKSALTAPCDGWDLLVSWIFCCGLHRSWFVRWCPRTPQNTSSAPSNLQHTNTPVCRCDRQRHSSGGPRAQTADPPSPSGSRPRQRPGCPRRRPWRSSPGG